MGKTVALRPPRRHGASRKPRRRPPSRRRYLAYLIGAAAIAVAARLFVVQGFHIPSRSMEDSVLLGDCLLVDKFSFGAPVPFTGLRLPPRCRPAPGDLVVFRYPPDPQRVYLKRCIAVAGQVVEIRDKVVYVDGNRFPDPPLSKYADARILPSSQVPRDNLEPRQVPAGQLFVMGDNRDHSRDSRHWGFLPLELVVGRAWCVYWSCAPAGPVDWADLSGLPRALAARALSLPERIRWDRLGSQLR